MALMRFIQTRRVVKIQQMVIMHYKITQLEVSIPPMVINRFIQTRREVIIQPMGIVPAVS